jgi:YidC/Oxa1 family membrane protein insertase
MVCILIAQYFNVKNQPKPKVPDKKIKETELINVKEGDIQSGTNPVSQKEVESTDTSTPKVTPDLPVKAITNYGVDDTPDNQPEKTEVLTKLFRFTFNSKGGILETLQLNEYKQTYKKDSGVYTLIDRVNNDHVGSFAVKGLEELFANASFQITKSTKDQVTTITMTATKQGLKVEKTLEILDNEYDFKFKIKVTNHRPSDYLTSIQIIGVADMEFDFKDASSILSDQVVTMIEEDGDFISTGDAFWSKTYGPRQGLSTIHTHKFEMGPIRKTPNGKYDKAKVVWGAVKNRYFTIIGKPHNLNWSVKCLDLNKEVGKIELTNPQLIWVAPSTSLATGKSYEDTFMIYAGPMKNEIINAERYKEHNFVEVIDYGFMFPKFIKVIDWILEVIISVIGVNQYWLGIILLTLLIRLCMFPITKKSSMSQAKLQTITPKMKDLKEKYKGDTKKLNEEMMKLYRKEGVNPFTSCLPMLIQLPIFFGLYSTLNLTFEVRFKSFLWINDLATADHMFHLGFTIPFLGEYFNLLPLVYAAINYVTMSSMPVPQDEMQAQQQKIMKYMFPVMMLMFFYRMPSALVLYFIISGTWTIIEQKKIRAKLDMMKANA